MKKILAMLMAVVMIALPVLSFAETGSQQLAAANANGKKVSGFYSLEAGDLSVLGDETLVQTITDILDTVSVEVKGQDNQAGITVYFGETAVFTAAVELLSDAIVVDSDWLPTQLVINGEDVRTIVVDMLLALAKMYAGEEYASYVDLIAPTLEEMDYTFNLTGFADLYAQQKALKEFVDTMAEAVLAEVASAFTRTADVLAQYVTAVEEDGAAYYVDGTVIKTTMTLDSAALKNVVNALCDDIGAMGELESVLSLVAVFTGMEIDLQQVLDAVRTMAGQALDAATVTVEVAGITTVDGELVYMFVAESVNADGVSASMVVEIAHAVVDGADTTNVTYEVTQGIESLIAMDITYCLELATGAEAVYVTYGLGEALTGVEGAGLYVAAVSNPSTTESGDVEVQEVAAVTVNGIGGTGDPMLYAKGFKMSADPDASFASADAVHVLAIDSTWMENAQNLVMQNLMAAVQLLPESVQQLLMAQ